MRRISDAGRQTRGELVYEDEKKTADQQKSVVRFTSSGSDLEKNDQETDFFGDGPLPSEGDDSVFQSETIQYEQQKGSRLNWQILHQVKIVLCKLFFQMSRCFIFITNQSGIIKCITIVGMVKYYNNKNQLLRWPIYRTDIGLYIFSLSSSVNR